MGEETYGTLLVAFAATSINFMGIVFHGGGNMGHWWWLLLPQA